MSKKWIRCLLLAAVIALLLYNSVYFKKLDAKTATAGVNLSPADFAQQFWAATFQAYLDSAVEVNSFVQQMQSGAAATIARYSKTQGIGNTVYFLLKGEGVIDAVQEDTVTIVTGGAAALKVKLVAGNYFGNAVRDVTGKIGMGDFANTMDYNTVSAALNKIVQAKVLQPFKASASKGQKLQFTGCATMNTEKITIDTIVLLPVKIMAQ